MDMWQCAVMWDMWARVAQQLWNDATHVWVVCGVGWCEIMDFASVS